MDVLGEMRGQLEISRAPRHAVTSGSMKPAPWRPCVRALVVGARLSRAGRAQSHLADQPPPAQSAHQPPMQITASPSSPPSSGSSDIRSSSSQVSSRRTLAPSPWGPALSTRSASPPRTPQAMAPRTAPRCSAGPTEPGRLHQRLQAPSLTLFHQHVPPARALENPCYRVKMGAGGRLHISARRGALSLQRDPRCNSPHGICRQFFQDGVGVQPGRAHTSRAANVAPAARVAAPHARMVSRLGGQMEALVDRGGVAQRTNN